uniref:Uncharacterized protein n=1 Tax=Ciona intestinalis TaxID=7719 RepID=H2XJF7_CIOIN
MPLEDDHGVCAHDHVNLHVYVSGRDHENDRGHVNDRDRDHDHANGHDAHDREIQKCQLN